MNKYIFTLIAIFSSCISFAEGTAFKKLETGETISLNYYPEKEEAIDVNLLFINETEEYFNIPTLFTFIWNKDTILEYLNIEENFNGTVKTLFLKKGDSLTINFNLHNPTEFKLKKVKGNITIKESLNENTFINNKYSFAGEYFDKSQWIVFKDTLIAPEKGSDFFQLNINLTKNFIYDNLHIHVNVLQPDSAFHTIDKSIMINTSKTIDFKSKKISLKLEDSPINLNGKYLVEIILKNKGQKINGIKEIELVTVK